MRREYVTPDVPTLKHTTQVQINSDSKTFACFGMVRIVESFVFAFKSSDTEAPHCWLLATAMDAPGAHTESRNGCYIHRIIEHVLRFGNANGWHAIQKLCEVVRRS